MPASAPWRSSPPASMREEALLLGRGAREQRRELLPPHRAEPGPLAASIARRRDRPRRPRGSARRRGRREVAQRRPADAGAALAQLAREVADDDRDLVRRRAAQAVGERRDLGEPRARGGDGGGGGDEIGEQHGRIVRERYAAVGGAASAASPATAPPCRAGGRARRAALRARRASCGTRRPGRQPPRAGCRPCAPSARASPRVIETPRAPHEVDDLLLVSAARARALRSAALMRSWAAARAISPSVPDARAARGGGSRCASSRFAAACHPRMSCMPHLPGSLRVVLKVFPVWTRQTSPERGKCRRRTQDGASEPVRGWARRARPAAGCPRPAAPSRLRAARSARRSTGRPLREPTPEGSATTGKPVQFQ